MDSVKVILLNQSAWEKYEEKSLTNEMCAHSKATFLSPVPIFAVVGLEQDKLYNVFLEFNQVGSQYEWKYEYKWIYHGLEDTSQTKTMVHSIKHPDGDRVGIYWMYGAICFHEVQVITKSEKKTAAEYPDQIFPIRRNSKYFLSFKIRQLESGQEFTFDFTKTEFIAISHNYCSEEVKIIKDQQRFKTSSYANTSRLKRKYGEIFKEPPMKRSAQIDPQSSSSSSFDHQSSSAASSTIGHSTTSSLTYNIMSMQLTEKEIWQKYKNIGNEMVLAKSQTRKLIPGPCFEVSGLKSDAFYNINLQFRLTHTSVSYKNCPTWELKGDVNEHIIDGTVRHDYKEQTGEIWNGLKFIDFSLVNIKCDGGKNITKTKYVRLKSRVAYVLTLEIVEENNSKQEFVPIISTVNFFMETQFITVGSYLSDEIKRLKTNPELSRRLQIIHERKRRHREMIYLRLPSTSNEES